MKLLSGAILAVVLGLAAVASAQMEQPFVPTDRDVQPWEAGHTVTTSGMGELSGRAVLTGKGRLIVVQRRTANQLFVVGTTRYFDAAGRSISSAALREGDQVKVDYDLRGNTAIARRVTILARPSATP